MNRQFYWFRFLFTALLLTGLLSAVVIGGARSAWRADPTRPAAELVAPDVLTGSGANRTAWIVANVCPLQRGLGSEHGAIYYRTPGAEWRMLYLTGRTARGVATPATRPGVYRVPFRLGPESRLGDVQADAAVYVLSPGEQACLIALETIDSSGRYDWSEARRAWLIRQLGGRRPIYLADVGLDEYGRVRSQLESADWPAGPLLMRQYDRAGRPLDAARQERMIRQLLDWGWIRLAVVSDLPHNVLFRREIQGWNARHRRPGTPGEWIEVMDWPADYAAAPDSRGAGG
ncbi:MAG: hypothetical protein BIFFINMI_01930 [Phycisphaerae bacterium]|nr:hypothetical protein [Phycisphaerae bacterium]